VLVAVVPFAVVSRESEREKGLLCPSPLFGPDFHQQDPHVIDTAANTETAPTSDGRANQTTMSALIDARQG
jgi:hypothetical protein